MSSRFSSSARWVLLALCLPPGSRLAEAQCADVVAKVATAATCTAQKQAPTQVAAIDPAKPYQLDELIDLAETNNPRTRISWERAKQAAERVGISRSEYFPHLAGIALFGDSRSTVPFPEPLAPVGYTMVQMPVIDAGFAMEYTIFDFGRRKSRLESSKALQLASAANFQRTTQDVAYNVVLAYYSLVTAQERLTAVRQILDTARTTQAAAEAQMENGRATLPDVLNARAVAAQAAYDLEAAIGNESVARVKLREALGVEPSDEITVAKPAAAPDIGEVSDSVTKLVEVAMQDRPDLASLSEKLHAAKEDVKTAQSSYRPTVSFQSAASSQSIWPKVSQPALGNTTQFVWSAGVKLQWTLFDGGERKNEVLARQSEERQAAEELREKRDQVTRETWDAYLQFRTAVRQQQASQTLLTAATTSYDASLDAYRYGVKNLIDLVSAESQLAQARLADVQARSAVLTGAANLGYTTGNLLRQRPDATRRAAPRP